MHLCFFLWNALLWKWNYVCITTKIFAWKCLGVLLGTFISGGGWTCEMNLRAELGSWVRGRAAQSGGGREKVWSISNASRLSSRMETGLGTTVSVELLVWLRHGKYISLGTGRTNYQPLSSLTYKFSRCKFGSVVPSQSRWWL